MQGASSLGEIMTTITSEPARPLQAAAPWVPLEVAAIVHRALQIKPERRFEAAAEMVEAIRACTPGGLSIERRMLSELTPEERRHVAARLELEPPTIDERAPATSMGASSNATVVEGGRRAAPYGARTRTALAVAGLLAVALCGFAGARIRGKRASQEPAEPLPTEVVPAAPSPAVTMGDPAPTEVKLGIQPGDANVDVDGTKAEVTESAVLLSGKLGSVHAVHVRHEGHEPRDVDVVITTQGPIPAAIALPPVKKSAVRQPTSRATAPPSSIGTAAKPAAKPGGLAPVTSFD
jgi:serine/threonine-protein kinase